MINLKIEYIDEEALQLVNAIEVRTTFINPILSEKDKQYYSALTLIKDEKDLLFQNFKLRTINFTISYLPNGRIFCKLHFIGRKNDLGASCNLLGCQIVGLRCEADLFIREYEIANYLFTNSNEVIFDVTRMERITRSYATHCAYFVTNEDARKNWLYYLLMMDKARREGAKPIEPPPLREL